MAEDQENWPESRDTTAVLEVSAVDEAELDAEHIATVIVMSGPRVGMMMEVGEEGIVVGREPANDLHLPDPGVSRTHAKFYVDGDAIFLEDMESSNGTFVNGSEIERPRTLEDGDKITIGSSTLLKFAYQDPVEQSFQKQMYEASLRDDLTDAYNKAFLEEHLRSELSFAKRHDSELSLVLFDLDHFKELNDTFGHVTGDAVLCEVAERMRDSIRTEDLFARYGGEEFAVVLRGVDLEGAYVMAERIRRVIAGTPYQHEEDEISVSTSAGVASYQLSEPEDVESFISIADEALYEAKAAGRNQVWRAG